MLFRFALLLIATVILMSHQTVTAQPTPAVASPGPSADDQVYVPGELFVKAHPDIPEDEMTSLVEAKGGRIVDRNFKLGFYRVRIADQVETAAFSLQLSPAVMSARPNYILAEVRDEFITLYDMELMIQRMLPAVRSRFVDLPAKQELLQTMFEDKLILLAAREENFQRNPDVQREINAAVDRVLINAYKRNMKTAGVASEREMQVFYEENIERYERPEQIRGQCILLETREEAEDVLELLRAGSEFSELAMERSIDPTSQKGGAFGWVRRDQMPTALGDAAFALEKGEVTEIVETPSGFYILKLTEKNAPGALAFSEARDRVERDLETSMEEEGEQNRLSELEKTYRGKLHPEFLSELNIVVTAEQMNASLPLMREVINSALETPYRYYPVD